MKTLLMAVLLVCSSSRAARAQGAAPQSVSQDPLTRQIERQAIQPGSGIVSVVRLGSGQTVPLKAVDEGEALAGLKPAAGLVEKPAAKPKKAAKAPKQAKAQAVVIEKDGWTAPRGAGHRGAL